MSRQLEEFVIRDENYQVETTTSEDGETAGFTLTGKAIPLGKESRNGVIYEPESAKHNAGVMEGNAFLFNHDFDSPIGHVKRFEPVGDSIMYEVDVDPQSTADDGVTYKRKFERGDIRHVSIHAMGEVMEPQDAMELDLVDEPDEESVVLEVTDWLELSAVTVPGFSETDMRTDGQKAPVAVSELAKQRLETVRVLETLNRVSYDDAVETSWEAPEVEDFESFDEYADVHVWWSTEEPEETEEVSLPIARPSENGGLEVVYEALNSAHDLASRAVPNDEVSRVRSYLESVREEEFSDREPLDANEHIDKQGNTDNDSMSEDETNQSSDEAAGDVSAEDVLDFTASHFEGVDVADLTDAMDSEGGEYVGELDMREVASLVADRLDEEPGTVLDAMQNLSETTHDDDEDDDMEQGSDEEHDSDEEEQLSAKELKEELDSLKQQVEMLVQEDTPDKDKQPSAYPNRSEDINSFESDLLGGKQ